jgi:hypothetical protein
MPFERRCMNDRRIASAAPSACGALRCGTAPTRHHLHGIVLHAGAHWADNRAARRASTSISTDVERGFIDFVLLD